jgi:hypothetical protein
MVLPLRLPKEKGQHSKTGWACFAKQTRTYPNHRRTSSFRAKPKRPLDSRITFLHLRRIRQEQRQHTRSRWTRLAELIRTYPNRRTSVPQVGPKPLLYNQSIFLYHRRIRKEKRQDIMLRWTCLAEQTRTDPNCRTSLEPKHLLDSRIPLPRRTLQEKGQQITPRWTCFAERTRTNPNRRTSISLV